jgi:hypothetical protein
MKDKTGSYRFVVSGADSGRVSGSVVLLYPFKNLAAREFSFPFHGTSKVRDALKLQYKPLLGEGMRNVGFIPFFTGTEKKSSAGCLFITHESETEAAESEARGVSDDCVVWPAPLAFAGEVGPDGLIVWSDGGCVISVWISNWTPALYRVAPPGATPEDEERDALTYIERAGGAAEKVLLVDASDVSVDSLQACGTRTTQLCPAYAQLDLSSRGANIQEEREKLLDSIARVARVALISGVICLLGAVTLYARQSSSARALASSPARTYETAFGERSMQPVTSAMSRLREARDGGRPMTMSSMLEDIASAYGASESSADMAIETLRYGSDGAEAQGSAASNELIQKFRSKMEELGYSVKIENIQTIPGGNMRFGMSMSRPSARSGQERQ